MYSILVLFLVCGIAASHQNNRSFTIDYERNSFLKDGELFQYYSGSMHYFRTPPELWADRLRKMKFAGLDAVQTYVEWRRIEATKGEYDFSGINNIVGFIQEAQKADLLVILRPGPYICAERDLGGFPVWLQREPGIKLRTSNKVFMKAIEKWFSVLLPMIRPYLYENGGPIIMVQVENEYGSFAASCKPESAEYKKFMYNVAREFLGEKILLFTTDGHYPHYVKCGSIPGTYPTIDFGVSDNITRAVEDFRKFQPKGPLVNSEFYTGWLDHWSNKHEKVDTGKILVALEGMAKFNFSVNLYMFHGGTNFGFTTGSNVDQNNFYPDPTSYDYDSPLTEAGDLTPKFFALKKFIENARGLPEKLDDSIAPVAAKMHIPPIRLSRKRYIFDENILPVKTVSRKPLSFEELQHDDGFVLYKTTLPKTQSSFVLSIPTVSDRALIYVNQVPVGKMSRTLNISLINVTTEAVSETQELAILVENQGRINYGELIGEHKGILSDVFVDNVPLTGLWSHFPLYKNWTEILEKVENSSSIESEPKNVPTFFSASFTIPEKLPRPEDTFLSFDRGLWHKGVAFLNGRNLGRYWPYTGPQRTLYVPSVFFKPYPEPNVIVLLELERAACDDDCLIEFVPHFQIDSPVHPD